MTKKYKHVYCTCCIYGKKWIEDFFEWQNSDYSSCRNAAPELPNACRECYPYDPEDSKGNDLRVNYKESLSGWWWLTNWAIEEFFHYQ